MTAVRVGVIGASGRMGSTVCTAVSDAGDMELVAQVDPASGTPIEALTAAGANVAVDFTIPSAVVANAEWCAAHGISVVIGTTGVGPAELERLGAAFPADGPLGCFVAPNFAIGAVLMIRFAELAAPWFPTAEIIELHHDRKVDAPSGTALLTAVRMAEASESWGSDPTRSVVVDGARGGYGPGGIRIHSVRLSGLVAHQEVLLGGTGETLTIRHDSLDRVSFMPGVLLAVAAVADGRPGVTVGLEHLLGI